MSELAAQFDGKATSGPDPVSLSDVSTLFLGPLDLQAYNRYTLYVQNVGGGSADDITEVLIQSAPTATGPWLTASSVAAVPIAAAAVAIQNMSNQSNKYVQVKAKCGGGNDTTAKFWLSVGGAL